MLAVAVVALGLRDLAIGFAATVTAGLVSIALGPVMTLRISPIAFLTRLCSVLAMVSVGRKRARREGLQLNRRLFRPLCLRGKLRPAGAVDLVVMHR